MHCVEVFKLNFFLKFYSFEKIQMSYYKQPLTFTPSKVHKNHKILLTKSLLLVALLIFSGSKHISRSSRSPTVFRGNFSNAFFKSTLCPFRFYCCRKLSLTSSIFNTEVSQRMCNNRSCRAPVLISPVPLRSIQPRA